MADNKETLYEVWWDHAEAEETMEEEHVQSWEEVIRLMKEQDLSASAVLDFGCNRGGFLRYLYEAKPFREGVGIDMGAASIEIANARKGALPIRYAATGSPESLDRQFDVAFALAVIYLIEDLSEHARKLKQSLKPGGAYYVTYTDLTDNPSAEHFKKGIEQYSHLKVQMHTLDDIASAFATEGFRVEVMRRKPAGFTPLLGESEFFKSVGDQLAAQYEQAYLFRFSLPMA